MVSEKIKVIKRNGKYEPFDYKKIYEAIFSAASEILPAAQAKAVAELTLPKALAAIKKQKKSKISIEDIQDIVEESLMKAGYPEVARAYILYRKYRQNIRLAKERLGIKDELKLSLNAVKVLKERYLLKDDYRHAIETPSEMFRRVAGFIAQGERNFIPRRETFFREQFFAKLTALELLPNSPTLMNAATNLGQLSACFVLPVEDSMDGIFSTLRAMALIHQSGGGTGFSFSRLRPKNDLVFSTLGVASGPVSFMQVFDAATGVIMQGGRRRGANMAVLSAEHPDISEFIEAKLKEDVLKNFNISVGITDKFMQALKNNRTVGLINPRTQKVVKQIKAKALFSLIALSAYKYADPGLIFLDEINRKHPLRALGRIEATNPCGEIPLLPYESCNLASVNLAKFVKDKRVNWQQLKETIKIGVRFLDNVIEVNKYPLKEIELITKKNRKIGLGVMGFADMLIKLRIAYGSAESIAFARSLMKFIRSVSLEASRELAKERGVFSNWRYSIYAKKNLRLRNATLNSIAPTGSISIIAGCSSGIEPLFALSFTRNILGGARLFEPNHLLEEVAQEEGLYSRRLMNKLRDSPSLEGYGLPRLLRKIFVTAFDIPALSHLKVQAAFQEFTDNAVSKTINLPQSITAEDVEKIYLAAYALKLKGITVYRYGSKHEQVLTKAYPPKEDLAVIDEDNLSCRDHSCLI